MTEQRQDANTKFVARDPEAARRIAIEAARSISDDKCEDVLVLDLRGRSQVTEYFVIGTGSSDRQMRSAALRAGDVAREMGATLFRSNKDDAQQSWIIMDFVDVVVHVFEAGARAFYDLETLWGDAPKVDWRTGRPPRRGAEPASPSTKAARGS